MSREATNNNPLPKNPGSPGTLTRSSEPFPEALQNLIETLDISKRWIATQTKDLHYQPMNPLKGRPPVTGELSPTFLGEVSNGRRPVRPEHIEMIAQVTGIQPEYFLEYRQHLARIAAEENVDAIGLERLLDTIKELVNTK